MKPAIKKMISYSQHTNIRKVIRNEMYQAAKMGDHNAAMKLVSEVYKNCKAQKLRLHPNAHILPVPGLNALPKGLAVHLQYEYGNMIDIGFEMIVKPNHTGQNAIYRLLNPPIFSGYVTPGREYFIVDDIATTGSTLQSLRKYIEDNGGIVIGVSVLASSYGGCNLGIKSFQIKTLRARFGLTLLDLLKSYGVVDDYEELTRHQARYLQSFESLYSLRKRIYQG